jgi:hypothetical protein
MRLPCRALIAGNHLNADAITTAIITNDHGTPARFDCPLFDLASD